MEEVTSFQTLGCRNGPRRHFDPRDACHQGTAESFGLTESASTDSTSTSTWTGAEITFYIVGDLPSQLAQFTYVGSLPCR